MPKARLMPISQDYEAERSLSKSKRSQEESKEDIVTQLVNMNQNVRCATRELETRLDKAYRSGAGKKYGYNSVSNLSVSETSERGSEERKWEKMESDARQFISSTGAVIPHGSANSKRPRSKNVKNNNNDLMITF